MPRLSALMRRVPWPLWLGTLTTASVTPAVPTAVMLMMPPPLVSFNAPMPSVMAVPLLPSTLSVPPCKFRMRAVVVAVATVGETRRNWPPRRLLSALVVLSRVNTPPVFSVSVPKPIFATVPLSKTMPPLTVSVPRFGLDRAAPLLSAVRVMVPVPILVTLNRAATNGLVKVPPKVALATLSAPVVRVAAPVRVPEVLVAAMVLVTTPVPVSEPIVPLFPRMSKVAPLARLTCELTTEA